MRLFFVMTNTAATVRRKVTLELEAGDPSILGRLSSAVRSVHGAPDPDLEQEAFIRTLRAFRREPAIEFPEALMWKVVRNTVADHWRQALRNRVEDIDTVAEHHFARQPDVDERIDRERNASRVRDALYALGCDTRGPMYLFYVEGYPIRKIAELYGKSVPAIKMALCRGRRQVTRICKGGTSRQGTTNKSR